MMGGEAASPAAPASGAAGGIGVGSRADKDEDEKPSKKRKFDAQSAKTTLAPMLEGLLGKVKKNADDAMRSATLVLKEIEDSEWKATFKDGALLLRQRLDCAKAVWQTSMALADAEAALTAHRAKEDVQRRYQDDEEPMAGWDKLVVWPKHISDAMTFKVSDEDGVVSIKATTKEGLVGYEELVARVRDQARRMTQSLKKKVDSKERDAE